MQARRRESIYMTIRGSVMLEAIWRQRLQGQRYVRLREEGKQHVRSCEEGPRRR